MNQKILEFLENNRVCALAVCMPDGSVHGATMHYSHQDGPLRIHFMSHSTSIKCKGLVNGQAAKASVTIGFTEETMQSLQMDGEIKIITDASQISVAHYAKHPNHKKYSTDPTAVFLEFTPTWWRYSDFKQDIFLSSN